MKYDHKNVYLFVKRENFQFFRSSMVKFLNLTIKNKQNQLFIDFEVFLCFCKHFKHFFFIKFIHKTKLARSTFFIEDSSKQITYSGKFFFSPQCSQVIICVSDFLENRCWHSFVYILIIDHMLKLKEAIRFKMVFVCILLIVIANSQERVIKSLEVLQQRFISTFCFGCNVGIQKVPEICLPGVKYIAGLKESDNFNLEAMPISKNNFGIQNVTFYKIVVKDAQFEFDNLEVSQKRVVSGLLSLPNVTQGPIKGVVAYFHPTIFTKSWSPSNTNQTYFQTIAALYAAKNYAVLFADYPGYGDDDANVHPYVLFPLPNVRSMFYLLKEAEKYLEATYGKRTKQNPWKLMSAGYSQGGAYSIFFSACVSRKQSKDGTFKLCPADYKLSQVYKFVGAAGMEGAYDVLNVVKDFLFKQVSSQLFNHYRTLSQITVTGAKPPLAAVTLYSYATYNKNPFPFKNALVPGFYDMQCSGFNNPQTNCLYNSTTQYNIKELLDFKTNEKADNFLVAKAIVFSAFSKQSSSKPKKKYSSMQEVPLFSFNSLYALIDNSYFDGKPEFEEALRQSTIISYGNMVQHPVYLFTLKRDSVVSPLNTENFQQNLNVRKYKFQNKQFDSCDAKQKPAKLDHLAGEGVANVFTISFFNKIVGK